MAEITTQKTGKNTLIQPSRYQVKNIPVTIAIIPVAGSETVYRIIEPVIDPGKEEILDLLREHIIYLLRDKDIYRRFQKNFSEEFFKFAEEKFPLLDVTVTKVFEYYIWRDAKGLGPFQPLIDDPFVTSIVINGADTLVTVQHEKYGILMCSFQPTDEEINTLLKKISNRSLTPVDFKKYPAEIRLRSGLQVFLSWQGATFPPSMITIEKVPSHIKNESTINEEQSFKTVSSYYLHHGMIEVRINQSPDDTYIYEISLISLNTKEKTAVHDAKEENKRRSGIQSFQEKSFRMSSEDFFTYISQKYPDISKDRYHFLYVSFTFEQESAKWIRIILADHQVTRVLCTHPGTPVKVWHTSAPNGADTTFIPSRSDLNRFANFLITSSGKEVAPDNTEYVLKFKTGEYASLTRVRDDQGHYFRIDVMKEKPGTKNSPSLPQTGRNKEPVPELSHPPGEQNDRIEDLLTKVFHRNNEDNQSNKNNETEADTSANTKKSVKNRLLGPIQSSLKGLAFFSSKRKEKPERDEGPFPDTLQVPSVTCLQNDETGSVAEEAYWLFQPHAYAVILQNRNKERSYRVIEPELSPRERIILEETHETLRDVLVYDKPVTKGDLFLEYAEVANVVKTYDPKITDDRLSVLYYYLRRNLNGYGKIDSLMYDELLEDISCNGHDLPVYIHHRYYGSIPTSITFESEELNRFVLKLSQKADKQISLTSPLLDASLPNGSRAQITYSDVVSTKGSSFTIRKFRSDPMTPATLLAFGTYSDELLAFIWLALENRQSMIIVGGTASGKTSAMNAFSFFIPHNSKIVSLEDTREIQIPQKNWLPVQTRTSNTFNDRGGVDLFDLLKASLRQRPEYIIVGEVRGNEAQTLFQAMNSGHTTLSTLHAGNIEEALNRLTNEPINVPPAMFGALNLMVIQTFHYQGGRIIRRCDAIHEIVLGEGDKVNWNTLFEYEPKKDSFKKVFSQSKTLQTLKYMHNWSDDEILYQLDLRTSFLGRLRNQYSTDPEVLIQMISDIRRLA